MFLKKKMKNYVFEEKDENYVFEDKNLARKNFGTANLARD